MVEHEPRGLFLSIEKVKGGKKKRRKGKVNEGDFANRGTHSLFYFSPLTFILEFD